jgi:phosphoglycolate phosphatase
VVRLVLFDIDGTLIHTKGAGVQAFAMTFASEFHLAQGIEGVQFAGRTDPSIVREFFQREQIEPTAEHFQRFFDRYVFWLDYLLRKSQGGICAGVWNFIHNLQHLAQPPILGLLTGNIRLGAEIKLRHFYLWDNFAMGSFGDDHEDRNQLAGIARQRGNQLAGQRLQDDEIVVVGDTPLDVQCARSIQAKSLAVATGGATWDELAATKPNWLAKDLLEVSAEEICA